ncbi:P-loop containing nucleoside triphosphate hydrolase protein [Auriculariales sp. MPI-PUGE-AT-0066]|nr:P-loop containing nucleoside triphosphate hydrolase protein [Auriculariales sp. MPI-PUGE-AT-0066]
MSLWHEQSHPQLVLFHPAAHLDMPTPCRNEAAGTPRADCRLDLTLGFEYRVLTGYYGALTLLLSTLAVYSAFAHKRVTKNHLDALALIKLVSAVAGISLAAAICAASRVLISNSALEDWQAAAYVLQLAYAISVALASMVWHSRSIAPSTLLPIALLLSALVGAAHLRTLILTSASTAIIATIAAFVAWQCVHLVFELVEKRKWILEDCKPDSHEPTASLVNRLSFAFLLPLLLRGRKQTLGMNDLRQFGLPPQMAATLAGGALATELVASSGALMSASRRALLPALLAPIFPKLVQLCATFAQPFVVRWMLEFIASDPETVEPARGWALVGAYAVIYSTLAVSTAFYLDKLYAAAMQFRAALVTVIGQKSLRLSASLAESEGSGATVYMSLDVERVVEGTAFLHEAWSALVALVLAAVIMWFQASFAVLSTIGVVLLFLVITGWAAGRVQIAQMAWMESTTARVKFITSMLTSIVSIKLSAIESRFPTPASNLRTQEVSRMKLLYRRLISVAVLSSATVNAAGLMALSTYIGLGIDGGLAPADLFTILTVVNLLALPISTIGHVAPQLLASLASFKRISNFLAAEEKAVPSPRRPDNKDGHANGNGHPAQSVEVCLTEASFALESGGRSILQDWSIHFKIGKVTMLVGPVGSGKSVLLRSLLGETYLAKGVMSVTTKGTAYAAQDAFILPATVRENIVLGRNIDAEWYHKVLTACSLDFDLAALPSSDLTVVGEGGQDLSGGQKQRIALARAVYAKADLILLDDCFSALDSHTARAVFDSLLGPSGLLHGKTVILATHSQTHLETADDIVVLKDGAIIAHGDLDTLLETHTGVDLGIRKSIATSVAASGASTPHPAEPLSSSQMDLELDIEIADPTPQIRPEPTKTNIVADDLDEDAGALSLEGWGAYQFYFSSCNKLRIYGTAAIIVLFSLFEIFLQVFLKQWSEMKGTSHGPWLGGYAAFVVAGAATAGLAFSAYSQWVTPKASQAIHSSMTDAVLAAPLSYFNEVTPSRLINRFSSDMNIVDFAFPVSLLDFSFSATFVAGILVLFCVSVPWIAIALPVMLYIYYYIQAFYLATSRQFQRLEMSSKTPLFRSFNTGISGLVTIRAFGAEELIAKQTASHLDSSQLPMYYRYAGIRFLRTMLAYCTLVIAVLVASLAVGLRSSTNAGFLGVALSQLVSLSQAFQNLILAWTRVENGAVSVERVRAITQAPVELKPTTGGWPSVGKIEFRNVTLRYRADLEPALKEVSFKIEPGTKLGICGRTGSGKSTIAKALLAAVDQSNVTGQILIDDVDIASMSTNTLRSSVSLVSQDPALFYLSIRENLIIGLDREYLPSDDRIWEVLDQVGMKDAVSKLPEQLGTVLSVEGLGFSRGERQLLCIARVILEKRKIVILDEASSSMDVKTDTRMNALLNTTLKDCTCLAIAHRISTVSSFDNIAVLSAGRIIEHGNPQQLLLIPSSQFAHLARNQGICT